MCVCVYVCVHELPWWACGGQRTTSKSQVSPSVAPRVRCGSLDLVADAFNSEPGEDTLNTRHVFIYML